VTPLLVLFMLVTGACGAHAPSPAPTVHTAAVAAESCKDYFACGILSASSVAANRIRDARALDLRRLSQAAGSMEPHDRVELSRNAAQDLAILVRDKATYVEHPLFVSSCPFIPDYAYEFRTPSHSSVWWLVATGCRKAALVDDSMKPSEWVDRAKYLSSGALALLERCNAGDAPDGSPAKRPEWLWSAAASCLSN
jgi:hypothetical protein